MIVCRNAGGVQGQRRLGTPVLDRHLGGLSFVLMFRRLLLVFELRDTFPRVCDLALSDRVVGADLSIVGERKN